MPKTCHSPLRGTVEALHCDCPREGLDARREISGLIVESSALSSALFSPPTCLTVPAKGMTASYPKPKCVPVRPLYKFESLGPVDFS